MRVLLTGGTGHLGRAIAAGLTREGHRVRILARRPGDDPGVEWVQGDLSAAPDLGPALAGVDAVVHAATDSPAARRGGFRPLDPVRSPTGVDIDGTAALLAAAAKAPVGHFLHVSITGLGQAARISPYARVKLAAEELVMTSSVPWSILRASGFHWLLERMLARMARRPVLVLPGDLHMQPVDSDDVAGSSSPVWTTAGAASARTSSDRRRSRCAGSPRWPRFPAGGRLGAVRPGRRRRLRGAGGARRVGGSGPRGVREWAAEMSNRTVHGVMHLAWVGDGTGWYRGRWRCASGPEARPQARRPPGAPAGDRAGLGDPAARRRAQPVSGSAGKRTPKRSTRPGMLSGSISSA
jgi:hypothetical protein